MKKNLLIFILFFVFHQTIILSAEIPLVKQQEDDKLNECPICLEPMHTTKKATIKLKTCEHIFHKTCIKKSFAESPAGRSCPYCRAVSPEEKARREKLTQREAIEDNETIDMLARIERQRRRRQSVFSQHCCIIQ